MTYSVHGGTTVNRSLNIVIADDEPVVQQFLADTVADFGHQVAAVAADGNELVEQCLDRRPDLAVVDVRMAGLDGLRAAQRVCREFAMPFVIVTGYDEWVRAAEVERECVIIYLVKPIGEDELRAAIDIVMQRFEEFHLLLGEEPDVGKALEDRQFVEKAKALYVRWKGISDRQAFEAVRRLAAERDVPLVDAAKSLLGGL